MTYDDDERVLDSDSDIFEDEPEPLFNFSFMNRKPKEPRKNRRRDYDYDEPMDDEYEEPVEHRRPVREEPRGNINYDGRRGYTEPLRPTQPKSAGIKMFSPQSFEDITKVAAALKEGCTALLNMENASYDDQLRIMDFMAGVVFATEAQRQCISKSCYIFAPKGVPIEGFSAGRATAAEEDSGIYI